MYASTEALTRISKRKQICNPLDGIRFIYYDKGKRVSKTLSYLEQFKLPGGLLPRSFKFTRKQAANYEAHSGDYKAHSGDYKDTYTEE